MAESAAPSTFRILGLIGSSRRLGNTEILVREMSGTAVAWMSKRGEAAAVPIAVDLIRLTELKLEPCTGCMRCVFAGEPCHLKDDGEELIGRLCSADALILGAPTYVLGPAAVVKMVLDRWLIAARWSYQRPVRLRPAGIVSVGGLPGWEGFSLSELRLFAWAFGFTPVGEVTAFTPGPGEVLLDGEAIERARRVGELVGEALLAPDSPPQRDEPDSRPLDLASPGVTVGLAETAGEPLRCPTCGSDLWRLREDGTAGCPVCGGHWRLMVGVEESTADTTNQARHCSKSLILLEPEQPAGTAPRSRWSTEALRQHVEDWIIPTGTRFKQNWPRIKPLLARYRDSQKKSTS